MSDLDAAANAFSSAMTTETAVTRAPKSTPPPSEAIFRNGELDKDSDETAGGDEVVEEVVEEGDDTEDEGVGPIDDDEDENGPAALDEDDGDEGEEAEEELEPGELDLKQEVEVIVDKKPVKVSLDEALKGYIRQETFHQRLNKLNDVEKAVRDQAVEVIKDRERYTQMIDDLDSHLQALVVEPDWDKLYAEDPKSARELQKRYDTFKTQRSALAAEKERVTKEAAEKEAQTTAEYGSTELRTFIGLNPQWKKPEDMQKDLQSMQRTAASVGFSQDEIASVLDHRMLVVLQKAANYDRIMAAKPKPAVVNGKSQLTPGAGRNKGTAPKALARAQKQLSRSGGIDDASAVFAKILQRG